jgi:hypothetical protein
MMCEDLALIKERGKYLGLDIDSKEDKYFVIAKGAASVVLTTKRIDEVLAFISGAEYGKSHYMMEDIPNT